jgi:hypothetical protein
MPKKTKDSDLTLLGRKGAHKLHATHDSRRTSQAGRDAFNGRFEEQIDRDFPDLDPLERSKRAEHLKKAYFADLALKSAQARRSRKDNAASSTHKAGRSS